MIRPSPDSHGRSALLEFSRSPLLERNAPPAVALELATTTVRNIVYGFIKWTVTGSVPDWEWYPIQRDRFTYDAEFFERLSATSAVSLNSGPPQFSTSISPGFNTGLSGYRLVGIFETVRTPTTIIHEWRYVNILSGAQKTILETITLEGTPVDVHTLADGFWSVCGTLPAPERPPLHTISTVWLEISMAVNDDLMTARLLSRALRQPPPSQDIINQQFAVSQNTSLWPNLLFDVNTYPQAPATLELIWKRCVFHMETRGEAQRGMRQRHFFDTTPILLSCERGFTEDYETLVTPVLSSTELDLFRLATASSATSDQAWIQRMLIPPNPAQSIFTC